VLSDSETPTAKDLTLEGTERIDKQSIAFDEMADFFVSRMEDELNGQIWVLEDEAEALYGVSDLANKSDFKQTDLYK
jgi:hypothetical protein